MCLNRESTQRRLVFQRDALTLRYSCFGIIKNKTDKFKYEIIMLLSKQQFILAVLPLPLLYPPPAIHNMLK